MSYNDFQYDFDGRYDDDQSDNDRDDRYTFGRANDYDAYEQSDNDDDRDDRSDDNDHYLNASAQSDDADDGRYNDDRSDNDDAHDAYNRSDNDRDDRYTFGRANDYDAYEQSDNDDDRDDRSDDNDGHDRYEYGAQFQPNSLDTDHNQGAAIQLRVEREEKTFSFDANGNIVGIGEIRANGTIKAERIDQDESYTRFGNFVIKTETEGFGKTEFTAYADGDGDGRWAEVAEGYGQMSIASFVQMIPANYSNFG